MKPIFHVVQTGNFTALQNEISDEMKSIKLLNAVLGGKKAVVDAQGKLDRALNNLMELQVSLFLAGESWTRWPLKVLSNPKDSVSVLVSFIHLSQLH